MSDTYHLDLSLISLAQFQQRLEKQKSLSEQTGIARETLGEQLAFSDLVRISGVGPVFARMLYDIDVQSTSALAEAQAAPLFNKLIDLNIDKAYTRAAFTEKDVAYCIELAQMLSNESAAGRL